MATKQKINLSVPASTAITDGKGVLKQEWRLWFNKIYQRLGGDAAYSNTDLEDFIININSQVDTINTTITTLQTELNNVNDEITLIQNNITTINDNITILQNSITDINNNINTINNSITTINNSITTINTTLSSLTTQVNTNTSDIATLNSSVIKTIASVGAGISIWLSKVGNTANFKSLKAGTNITLDNTTDPNEIVINSSGGTSYTLPPATSTTLGGVIIPSSGNLSVDGSGNLSVPVATSSVLGLVKVDGTTITVSGGVISAVSSGGGVNEGTGSGHNSSVVYSQNGLQVNTTGTANSGVGYNVFKSNTTGYNNTAMGNSAAFANVDGNNNTTIGVEASKNNNHGNNNTVIGYQAGYNNTWGAGSSLDVSNNTFIGYQSGYRMVGGGNVAIGYQAMYGASSSAFGGQNIAIGGNALYSLGNATGNVAVGSNALYFNTTGTANFGMGSYCLFMNTTGSYNTGLGVVALRENTTGTGNIGIGLSSYRYSNANYQTGIGYLSGTNSYWDNTTCIGANTDCTGANQVQIGSSTTTVYVYGTVQNRSDARDKADITYDTDLGLDFIKKLKPAQWRWDLRENYRKTTYTEDGEIVVYFEPKDGSKKRKRLHNGFIAQDLQDIILQTGIDFAGFQDHNIDNGNDVLSVGYDEFIAPIVKAIQEQQQIIDKQQQQINDLQNILQKLTEKVGV